MSGEEDRDKPKRKSLLPKEKRLKKVEKPANIAENSDSEDEPLKNRIGNVPLEWYKDEDHIGYDVYGKPIMRKDHGDSIDAFLARTDDPNAGRTVYDALNDEKVVLTDAELSIINRLRKGKLPYRSSEQWEDTTGETEVDYFAIGTPTPAKASFIPSKWEAMRVLKYINALRNGWIRDPRVPREKPKEQMYDLWGDNDSAPRNKHVYYLPPPKPPLPGHAESFNPPPEYLWSAQERAKQLSLDLEDRMYDFEPKKFTSLRQIPHYPRLVQERFQRNLDLYMGIREKRRTKANIDPDSLIPQLPKPKDLRPFPTTFSLEYLGHTKMVRGIDVDPTGQWLISCSEDKTVRLWEISTARCHRTWNIQEPVVAVAWNPNPNLPMVAAATESGIALLCTGTGNKNTNDSVNKLVRGLARTFKRNQRSILIARYRAVSARGGDKQAAKKAKVQKLVNWLSWNARVEYLSSPQKFAASEYERDEKEMEDAIKAAEKGGSGVDDGSDDDEDGVLGKRKRDGEGEDVDDDGDWEAQTNEDEGVRGLARAFMLIESGAVHVSWHAKGDYLCSVSSVSTASSVIVHRISRALSHLPFSRAKGQVQRALFHPLQPLFFVATQTHVRVYDLTEQRIVKTLIAGTKWISSMSIHPQGDHLVVGGYDRRVCWFDLDASSTPFRTLKYHRKAVRSVCFHPRFPLMATASDDGCMHIIHNTVYTDLITDPLIVPVKIINAHLPVDDVGVLQCVFHPTQPWIFSAAGDKTIRLFS